MTAEELFAIYAMDRTMIGLPGYDVERFPHLTCFTPTLRDREGLITFASLNSGHERREIEDQKNYFKLVGIPFRWRIFEVSQPSNLRVTLENNGFIQSTSNMLMVNHFSRQLEATLPNGLGLRIAHIDSHKGIRDVLAVYSVAFKRSHSFLRQSFESHFERDPDTISMFCIYQGEMPVAAAWTEFPRGSQFPEMHPAAVLKSWRGKGLGVALDCVRTEEAHARFYSRVMAISTVERMDRMKALGFEPVASRSTMRLQDERPFDPAERSGFSVTSARLALGAMEEIL
jgi:N-acetylglutamate synthase-like GNAT family acetyltransferase